jgi:N-carbamoyl-L-amino-acid hydrolase
MTPDMKMMENADSEPSDNSVIQVNADRLWQSLMEMAKIGATADGGVCRVALTELDLQGRNLFLDWCRELGLAISIDGVGNLFARREGSDGTLAPVLIGSHLDSQPSGGRFDGVYGVLAGLEVLRTLEDSDITTPAAIEVCVWTNEEGSRYPPAMTGSGAFAGVFAVDEILDKRDDKNVRFGDALDAIGHCGKAPVGGRSVGTYLEAHIEQGPILEAEGRTIGVVTGGQAMRWYDVEVNGQEAHAGSTPMNTRRDALLSASMLVLAVDQISQEHGEDARATCGYIVATPNSRNTVTGHISMSVDLRHPDDEILAKMDAALFEACRKIDLGKSAQLEAKQIWHCPPTRFSPDCIEKIAASAERNGFSTREIVSGAGHDAFYLARVAPSGMIFIPCEDGISHNPIESATREDCAAGCQVLLEVAMSRAGL